MKLKTFLAAGLLFGLVGFSSAVPAQVVLDKNLVLMVEVQDETDFAYEEDVKRIESGEALPVIPTEKPEGAMGWIAFFSVIVIRLFTMLAPSTWQGQPWYNVLMKIINALAQNVWGAKNADDRPLKEANHPRSTI